MSTMLETAKEVSATDKEVNAVASNYYDELKKKADAAVGSIYHVSINPISSAGVGDFAYNWLDPNLQFNANTFGYVSRRVVPGDDGTVRLPDPFPNAYDQVLRATGFDLSTDDKERLNKAQRESIQQSTAVVQGYVQTFGPITPAMLEASGQSTNIDYVVNYVARRLWSCAKEEEKRPPTLMEMQAARDLRALLPCTPPSGLNLLPSISAYLNAITSVLPLVNASGNANFVLEALRLNTGKPTLANGGMSTVNSVGERQVRIGYNVAKAVNTIQNDLDNPGNKITVAMSAEQVDQTTLKVSAKGSAWGAIRAFGFLGLNASGGAEYNMFSFKGSGTSSTVEMEFTGYSFVPFEPRQYQQDTTQNWFWAPPIAQAVANGDKDVTGFRFTPRPPYDFGEGGDFGMLDGVLISNYPTIRITYEHGNYEEFRQEFEQHSKWSIRFLGIPIGSFEQSLYASELKRDSTTGSFSVTMTPRKEVLNVPFLDQTAYVIGGSVAYPGVATAPKELRLLAL